MELYLRRWVGISGFCPEYLLLIHLEILHEEVGPDEGVVHVALFNEVHHFWIYGHENDMLDVLVYGFIGQRFDHIFCTRRSRRTG